MIVQGVRLPAATLLAAATEFECGYGHRPPWWWKRPSRSHHSPNPMGNAYVVQPITATSTFTSGHWPSPSQPATP
jgi:hypothetical protein